MRVFYFTDIYPKLSEIFICREISAMLERGVEIRLLAMQRGRDTIRHAVAEIPGLEVLYRSECAPGWLGKGARHLTALLGRPRHYSTMTVAGRATGLPELRYHVRQTPWIASRVQRFRPSWIHCHFGRQGMVAGWLTSRLTGIPFSVTLHGSDVLVRPYPGLGTVLADASRIICVSRHLQAKVVESYGIPEKRIEIVHCGIKVDQFPLSRVTGGEPRLLFVGRLHEVKGLPSLIEACAILRDRGTSFTCTIVGDGPERAAVEAEIDAKELGSRIRLLGAQPNEKLPAIYAQHSILVLPSYSEGLSVVGMEAMAAGLSIVASRVGGLPELILDGINGRLVEPGDARELAEAILTCHRDRGGTPGIGERNRQRIAESFSLAGEITKLAAVFAGRSPEDGI